MDMENMEEKYGRIVKRYGKIQKKLWKEKIWKLNIQMIWKIWKKIVGEMIWTIWKKGKLNSEKIWKIRKKVGWKLK